MAITLNAIAQGHATDEIIALLKKNGIENALVNIGEYAALGLAPDGNPWQVELAASGEKVPLTSGRALAVSSGSGYTFDPDGRYHHIFRPEDGANTRPGSSIIVTAPSATQADALATSSLYSQPQLNVVKSSRNFQRLPSGKSLKAPETGSTSLELQVTCT